MSLARSPAAVLPTCCLLLLFVAGSRQVSITEFAVPSASEAGTNAELQCRFSEDQRVDYLKWWWTPLYVPQDDRNRVLIYQRLSGQPAELPRKNVEGKENDTIVLIDLSYVDSGIYECEVSGDTEVRKHQDLIVFSNGTDLQLNITKVEDGPDEDEYEDVLVQCEATAVSPQPELSIFVNGIEMTNLSQYLSGGEGLFDVSVNGSLRAGAGAGAAVGAGAGGAEVRCELFYANKNISHPPYARTLFYTTGAAQLTTEAPEDSTLSEVASELQNTNGVPDLRASLWAMSMAAVLQLYVVA